MTIEQLEAKREEIATAVNTAARALEAYWDAERDIELLTADDKEEADIPDLNEWIEPWAICGGEIDDDSLDQFLAYLGEMRNE